jgi:putative addiction module killer protein
MEVRIYEDDKGRSPFRDWFKNLKDIRARIRIRLRIDRIRSGNLGDWKAVGQGVSEMRVDYGPGYRVYFGREGSSVVILLSGGGKDTQARDIANAQKYWADWRAR